MDWYILACTKGEFDQRIQNVLRGSMGGLVQCNMYKGRAQSEISACTQGEYGQQNVYQGRKYIGPPFALDVKGEE